MTLVDPNRKVPDLYFKVVYPKLQVADLKAEAGELRSSGIPSNLTPAAAAAAVAVVVSVVVVVSLRVLLVLVNVHSV